MRKTQALAMFSIFVIAASILPMVAAAPNFNPNKLYGAPSYVLNVIGKKDTWSGGGTYDNPDRHTMFVPQTTIDNVTIYMAQGTEFAVLDGNAFDDGQTNLTLAPGKYYVFVVALGKPGGGANIEGWIYNATDNTYLLNIGSITVQGHSKTPKWVNATDLFFVSPAEDTIFGNLTQDTWVFDYLAMLSSGFPGTDYLYLWQLDNNNNKLLQVRFYQIG